MVLTSVISLTGTGSPSLSLVPPSLAPVQRTRVDSKTISRASMSGSTAILPIHAGCEVMEIQLIVRKKDESARCSLFT